MSFFDDGKKEEVGVSEEIEKIKLGDQEFTQEELSGLVEKGRLAKEIEEKQNTDISKVYPEYTKKSQQLKELEVEVTELRKLKQDQSEAIERKQANNENLTIDEVRSLAAKSGYITKENFQDYINNYMSGQKVLESVRNLEKEGNPYKTDELPKVESRDLLEWMDNNNIADPTKAYKLRYEKEIDEWKEKSLQVNKPKGIYVEDSSSPGNKLPKKVEINRGNLSDFVKSALRGEV